MLFVTTSCSNKADKEPQEEQYSIYKLAKNAGYNGSYEEWLESIKGEPGLSAYEIFLKYYPDYSGSEKEWITDVAMGNTSNLFGSESDKDKMISESRWNEIVQISAYNNVTVIMDTKEIEGVGNYKIVISIADDNCKIVEEGAEEKIDKETIDQLFLNPVLSIINDYSEFSYNDKNGQYSSAKTIIRYCAISCDTFAGVVKFTAENLVVELDENENIYKVICLMTQEFNGEKIVKNVEFTFIDYSTTVVK